MSNVTNKPISKQYLTETLKSFDKQILENKYITESAEYSVKKLDTPETGYLTSYQLVANPCTDKEVAKGATINIPHDFLVTKVSEVLTVETADSPVAGYAVGDKYVDFTVNTKDATDDATATHLYVNLTDLFNPFSEGDGITIDASGKISVALGVGLKIDEVTNETDGTTKKVIAVDFETEAIAFDYSTWDNTQTP